MVSSFEAKLFTEVNLMIRDIGKEIAALICSGDTVLNYKRWLAEEVGDLATKIPGLDAFPAAAVLPLSHLAAHGESTVGGLAAATGIEQDQLADYMESLCEFKFAQQTSNGYIATAAGIEAFKAIGSRMVRRERFVLQGQRELLDDLYERLPI